CVFDLGQTLAELVKGKRRAPAENAVREILIEAAVDEAAQPAVDGRIPAPRFENDVVLRPADIGLALQRMNRPVGRGMGQAEVAGYRRGLENAASASGRKLAQEITQGHVHVGFIEGGPVVAEIPQRGYSLVSEALEQFHRLWRCETAFGFEPQRISEMMESHERPDTSIAQRLEHLAIAAQRAAIPASLLRLDLAPFQRKPQCVHAQVPGAVKILLGVTPPVARPSNAIAGLDAPLLLPRRPL